MSNIEWCDITANPIHLIRDDGTNGGHFCQKISPGCLHCYAEKINQSNLFDFASHLPYCGSPPENLIFDEAVMQKLVKMRTGKKIFVFSMTDLFADWVPEEWIDMAFAYMALGKQHVFQILTKRPGRMQKYFSYVARDGRISNLATALDKIENDRLISVSLPLPNVWLGTSIENQQVAGDRIPLLLDTPAAIRFLSCEPLLEELNLVSHEREGGIYNYLLNAWEPRRSGAGGAVAGGRISSLDGSRIDWAIAGGESGPSARPCHVDWIRSLVRQCRQTKTAVFVKQWGSNAIASTSHIDGIDGTQAHFQANLKNPKGGDISELPSDVQIREFPKYPKYSEVKI